MLRGGGTRYTLLPALISLSIMTHIMDKQYSEHIDVKQNLRGLHWQEVNPGIWKRKSVVHNAPLTMEVVTARKYHR